MRKEFKYITVISMLFCLGAITWSGFRMPWNEEAAFYAIYGAAVGFCLAIVMSMFIVWRLHLLLRNK